MFGFMDDVSSAPGNHRGADSYALRRRRDPSVFYQYLMRKPECPEEKADNEKIRIEKAVLLGVIRNNIYVVEALINSEIGKELTPIQSSALQCRPAICDESKAKIKEVYTKYLVNPLYLNSITPLHVAFAGGCDSFLRDLLERGFSINSQDKKGKTPLHYAARGDSCAIVVLLLTLGASVDVKDVEGKTPLYIAVERGCSDSIQVLIKRGANINISNRRGETLLHLAVKKNNVSCVQDLLDHGVNVNVQDKIGSSPLHLAASNDSSAIVTLLLTHGATVNVLDVTGTTPLDISIERGSENNVLALLKGGAEFNRWDKNGETPLHRACQCSSVCTLSTLIRRAGRNFSHDTDGLSPLELVCKLRIGFNRIVLALVDFGADINCRDSRGNTAIHYAVQNDFMQPGLISFLMSRVTDVNAVDKDGKSLLQLALESNNETTSTSIISCGADIDFIDDYGSTALHLAAKQGLQGVLSCLLDRGADINGVDREGKTPLQVAFERDHDRVVSYLINRGADINIRDKCGRTALHLAAERGMSRAVLKLLKRGAKVDAEDLTGRTPLHLLSAVSAPIDSTCYSKYLMGKYKKFPYVSVRYGSYVASILLTHCAEHGVSVDFKGRFGKTALHVAAENGRDDIVQVLLKFGADVNVCADTAPNYTPLECALANYALPVNTTQAVVTTLTNHIVMLKTLNFPINDVNLKAINFNSGTVIKFKADCERDLERLKKTCLKGPKRISFYNLLTDNRRSTQAAFNFGNRSFAELLSSLGSQISRRVSHTFGNFIALQLCLIHEKNQRLLCLESITVLFGQRFAIPPGICVDEITQYLSNKDLKNFITACQ